MPQNELPPFQFQPLVMPVVAPVLKKQPQHEKCKHCGHRHASPGIYYCLGCGKVTCVGESTSGWTEEVVLTHSAPSYYIRADGTKARDDINKNCGPAIRLHQNHLTKFRIRKA